MEKQQLSLTDWQRIFMGDAPWIFLVELLYRALIVYFLLLLFMRLMGKRMASQMSWSEMSVILMLGAATGLPIQVPDKGLLPSVVVFIVILALHRGISLWTFKSRRAELVTYGDVVILLKDGRLLPDGLKGALLSPHKIFASLRTKGIEHLGQLRRVYAEASGDLTVIKYRKPRPGLLIIPQYDLSSGRYRVAAGRFACSYCGNIVVADYKTAAGTCDFCGVACSWHEAVIDEAANT